MQTGNGVTYREQGESPEDRDTTPRLSFRRRWSNTIFFGGGFWGVGWPVQLFLVEGGPSLWWVLAGVILTTITVVTDKKAGPSRLRVLERFEYIRNLPRTPDGGALVNRAEWEHHFPRNES